MYCLSNLIYSVYLFLTALEDMSFRCSKLCPCDDDCLKQNHESLERTSLFYAPLEHYDLPCEYQLNDFKPYLSDEPLVEKLDPNELNRPIMINHTDPLKEIISHDDTCVPLTNPGSNDSNTTTAEDDNGHH